MYFRYDEKNDEATRGQYLVKLITEPYTVEENTVMMKVEQHHIIFVGEIKSDAVFWNPAPMAAYRYTPMSKKEGIVMTRLKEVLITGVTMKMIRDKNMLPNKYNKKQAENQEARKIDDDKVCDIIEDIYRRDKTTLVKTKKKAAVMS